MYPKTNQIFILATSYTFIPVPKFHADSPNLRNDNNDQSDVQMSNSFCSDNEADGLNEFDGHTGEATWFWGNTGSTSSIDRTEGVPMSAKPKRAKTTPGAKAKVVAKTTDTTSVRPTKKAKFTHSESAKEVNHRDTVSEKGSKKHKHSQSRTTCPLESADPGMNLSESQARSSTSCAADNVLHPSKASIDEMLLPLLF